MTKNMDALITLTLNHRALACSGWPGDPHRSACLGPAIIGMSVNTAPTAPAKEPIAKTTNKTRSKWLQVGTAVASAAKMWAPRSGPILGLGECAHIEKKLKRGFEFTIAKVMRTIHTPLRTGLPRQL